VAQPARLEHRRAPDRLHPVEEGGAALAEHEGEREPGVEVLARDDLVEALRAEELRPALERVAVETLRVVGVEVFDFLAKRGPRLQSPMTSR
jgi:hypothetical protein